MLLFGREGKFVVVVLARKGCNVRVCVWLLPRSVLNVNKGPSLIVGYIKEKVQDVEVEMFLGIVFICSIEYVVCVCAASLVGKVVSKRRNGDMI